MENLRTYSIKISGYRGGHPDNFYFLDFLGDGGGGGRIFPSHPGPIPNVPRDNISRKGIPSLREYLKPW